MYERPFGKSLKSPLNPVVHRPSEQNLTTVGGCRFSQGRRIDFHATDKIQKDIEETLVNDS